MKTHYRTAPGRPLKNSLFQREKEQAFFSNPLDVTGFRQRQIQLNRCALAAL